MRDVSQWFSTLPVDDDGDNARRWYQRTWEWNGAPGYGPEWRWRLIVGDVCAEAEREFGDYAGAPSTTSGPMTSRPGYQPRYCPVCAQAVGTHREPINDHRREMIVYEQHWDTTAKVCVMSGKRAAIRAVAFTGAPARRVRGFAA